MNRRLIARLLAPRLDGVGAWVTTTVRIGTGVFFVLVSTGKFFDHASEAIDFHRYGVPIPGVAVYAVGGLELVCAALLVTGLVTRLGAGLLAANMVGAISTAGRVDGGSFNLGVAPAMLVAMVFLVWAGVGAFGVDVCLMERFGISPAARA